MIAHVWLPWCVCFRERVHDVLKLSRVVSCTSFLCSTQDWYCITPRIWNQLTLKSLHSKCVSCRFCSRNRPAPIPCNLEVAYIDGQLNRKMVCAAMNVNLWVAYLECTEQHSWLENATTRMIRCPNVFNMCTKLGKRHGHWSHRIDHPFLKVWMVCWGESTANGKYSKFMWRS